MKKHSKYLIVCIAILFFILPVCAYEMPEMIDIDVSETTLQRYMLSKTEVTQQLYLAVTGKNPSSCVQGTPAFSKMHAGEEQDNRPVETLTFFDAMWFCNLLTENELGKEQCVYTLENPVYDNEGRIIRFGMVQADFTKTGYRLPTSTEWQNAAGAHPASGPMYAWEFENSGARGEGRSGFGTHAVAQKLPDESGLYDMSGNVSEMCHDGEALNFVIMGTCWNETDKYYNDGYCVELLHGYEQYTVSRNHARESFAGYDTCGFRLCRSVSDLPFSLTGISVPDICDTYEGILPVTISGTGFLSRRTEPLSVSVEGFASKIAGNVQWLSDSTAIVPVNARALRIEVSQQASLRVIVRSSELRAEISGTVTRIHTEFPVHPGDVLLDDGSVILYEENRVFSGYETEHAAAVIIYAPYDGTEIIAVGLKGYTPSAGETPEAFVEAYGERAGIFGAYLGSGWHKPSEQELAPLSDASVSDKTERVLKALGSDYAWMAAATSSDNSFLPVKSINTRGLITQKYEYLSANNMLKEAAAQEALLAEQEEREAAEAEAARIVAEEEARKRAMMEAEEAARAAAEAEARAAQAAETEAKAAAEAEQNAAEADKAAVSEVEAETEAEEEASETEQDSPSKANEARTLIGFGLDVLKVTGPSQSLYAEFSTGLFTPYLYLAAEGNAVVRMAEWKFGFPSQGLSFSANGPVVDYWDAAVSLGLSVRMKLGSFHPGLFISGGAVTNQQLLKASPYVKVRLEAGLDIPLFKWLSLSARYTADLDSLDFSALLNNYCLKAGFSITFPDSILF